MKKLIFILSLAFFINAHGQDITKKLQSQVWFITGDLFRSEKCVFYGQKPSYTTNAIELHTDGNLKMDMNDLHDFKFVCPYEIKKDMLKIHYILKTPKDKKKEENITHYYKINEIPNTRDLELTRIDESEFK